MKLAYDICLEEPELTGELKAYLEQAGSSKVYRCSTSVYSESRRDKKPQHSAMLICPLSFTCA